MSTKGSHSNPSNGRRFPPSSNDRRSAEDAGGEGEGGGSQARWKTEVLLRVLLLLFGIVIIIIVAFFIISYSLSSRTLHFSGLDHVSGKLKAGMVFGQSTQEVRFRVVLVSVVRFVVLVLADGLWRVNDACVGLF